MSISHAVGKFVIGTYQRYVSQDYNRANHSRCLYHPSCSEYGRQVIAQDGVVRGGTEAAMRMVSCTGQVRTRHEFDFYEALRTHDPGDLPSLVTVTTPQVESSLWQLKRLTDRETVAMQQQSAELTDIREERDDILHGQLELRQIDRPTRDDGGPRYRLAPHRCEITAHSIPSAGWARRAAIGACAVAGACLVGAAGMVAVGLLGTATGPTLGVTAGLGKLHQLHERIAQKYSPDAVTGLLPLEEPMTVVGGSVHDFVARHTSSQTLARTLGVFMGATSGLGVGIAAGVIIGARTGLRMGYALGGNLARDLLKVPRR